GQLLRDQYAAVGAAARAALPAAVSVLEQAVGRLSATAGAGSGVDLAAVAGLVASDLGTAGLGASDSAVSDSEGTDLVAAADSVASGSVASGSVASGSVAPGPVAPAPEAADPVAPLAELLARTRSRLANADAFAAAYQRYCWPVEGLDGVRLAPFALLGSQGAAHHERSHSWHLAVAARLAEADPDLFTGTRHVFADTSDAASRAAAAGWWAELTE